VDRTNGSADPGAGCDGTPREAGCGRLARFGWYKRLQAFLLARGMTSYERIVRTRKQLLLNALEGRVVEIGPGAGANLQFYGPGVQWLGVEPNPYLHRAVRREAARLSRSIDLCAGVAEALPVDDASADAVVATLVFCSVHDPRAALREVLRVLKPGGRYVFIEHVAAPAGSGGRRRQRLIRPVWRMLADGCEPDRETWAAIEAAGFSELRLEHFRVPAPIVGPHISGVAVK
jgi:SAM-dependent methyltransferase